LDSMRFAEGACGRAHRWKVPRALGGKLSRSLGELRPVAAASVNGSDARRGGPAEGASLCLPDAADESRVGPSGGAAHPGGVEVGVDARPGDEAVVGAALSDAPDIED